MSRKLNKRDWSTIIRKIPHLIWFRLTHFTNQSLMCFLLIRLKIYPLCRIFIQITIAGFNCFQHQSFSSYSRRASHQPCISMQATTGLRWKQNLRKRDWVVRIWNFFLYRKWYIRNWRGWLSVVKLTCILIVELLRMRDGLFILGTFVSHTYYIILIDKITLRSSILRF